MSSRLKVFVILAILGFLAGVIAMLIATYVIPWIEKYVAPSLAGLTSYIVAGLAGAIIVVAIVGVWAYMTSKREPY